jgi:hypothetical protein
MHYKQVGVHRTCRKAVVDMLKHAEILVEKLQ